MYRRLIGRARAPPPAARDTQRCAAAAAIHVSVRRVFGIHPVLALGREHERRPSPVVKAALTVWRARVSEAVARVEPVAPQPAVRHAALRIVRLVGGARVAEQVADADVETEVLGGVPGSEADGFLIFGAGRGGRASFPPTGVPPQRRQ